MRAALHKKQRVFQFGTQQRSGRLFRHASELVRNGAIGDLKHINVWAPGSAPGGSRKEVPPPPGLDYDFWLGPAPLVPHTKNRCSADGARKTWWFISDYTLGFITGWTDFRDESNEKNGRNALIRRLFLLKSEDYLSLMLVRSRLAHVAG